MGRVGTANFWFPGGAGSKLLIWEALTAAFSKGKWSQRESKRTSEPGTKTKRERKRQGPRTIPHLEIRGKQVKKVERKNGRRKK
jgi:hypothetical protein